MHTHIHTKTHTYTCTYIHTHIHTHTYTHIHTHTHTYTHTYMLQYIHTYINTYIHTYMHAYIFPVFSFPLFLLLCTLSTICVSFSSIGLFLITLYRAPTISPSERRVRTRSRGYVTVVCSDVENKVHVGIHTHTQTFKNGYMAHSKCIGHAHKVRE